MQLVRWAALAILVTLLVSACGGASANIRCQPATAEQIASINRGIKAVDHQNEIRTGYAVKSKQFQNVYIVAAKIYGPGMENGTGPAVWAVGGGNPNAVTSVDGYAKQFSDWPDASDTQAGITMGSDGTQEAKSCAE